jgi:hypothetical protein
MTTTFNRGVPKGLRIGQFISNFIGWLDEKGIDLFYLQDEQCMKLHDEYLTYLQKTVTR